MFIIKLDSHKAIRVYVRQPCEDIFNDGDSHMLVKKTFLITNELLFRTLLLFLNFPIFKFKI